MHLQTSSNLSIYGTHKCINIRSQSLFMMGGELKKKSSLKKLMSIFKIPSEYVMSLCTSLKHIGEYHVINN